MRYPEKLFVTGTDTDIGKTVVSSILVTGLNAAYWKPIQAGRDPYSDTEVIKQWTGKPATHFHNESYDLSEPMSPHAAAEIDGISIDFNNIKVPNYFTNHLIIEGAGGLIVPVNDDQYMIDLISHLKVPVLLVAKSGLGTLNHTLMSLEALRNREIPVFGVVLTGDTHTSNEKAIIKFGNVDRLFRLELLAEINAKSLQIAFRKSLSAPINSI